MRQMFCRKQRMATDQLLVDPFPEINAQNKSAYTTIYSNFGEDLKSLGKTVQAPIRARMRNRRGEYKTIEPSPRSSPETEEQRDLRMAETKLRKIQMISRYREEKLF